MRPRMTSPQPCGSACLGCQRRSCTSSCITARDTIARPHAQLSESQLNTVGYVVSRYGGLTGQDLEVLTHSESPWQRANARRLPKTSSRIELSWMKEHFETVAAPDDDELQLDSAEVVQWLEGARARQDDQLRPDSPADIMARLR